MRNAPFQFEPTNWFTFFDQRGRRASEVRYIAEEAQRLGSRSRCQRMKRFAAYVVLTPR